MTTIMYLIIEGIRDDPVGLASARERLCMSLYLVESSSNHCSGIERGRIHDEYHCQTPVGRV